MVERVALFCDENARIEHSLEAVLTDYKENSRRLVDSQQSIVGAAWKAINHGIKKPDSHLLPPVASKDPYTDES